MNHLLFLNLGAGEIVVICLVILLLFGGKKIPDLARSLGKAKGEFKKGLAEGEKEEPALEDSKANQKSLEAKE